MAYTLVVSGYPGQTTASTLPTPTSGPGAVTITGGPSATANIPGPKQDPADFYGIIVVLIVMIVAIFATRWLFARRPGPPRSGTGRSSTGPAAPR